MNDKQTQSLEKLREKCDILIALAGNPNVGKSSIFNSLTGLGVMTANYAGKTVELNVGMSRYKDKIIGIVDIPGTYSLDSHTEDQEIARKALLENSFDVVVDVIDTTNLSRNLYLLFQLAELGLPLIADLNLYDLAEKRGITIDTEKLEEILGIPVVVTSALRGDGIDNLMEKVTEFAGKGALHERKIRYSPLTEEEIGNISRTLTENDIQFPFKPPAANFAPLILEGDREMLRLVEESPAGAKAMEAVAESRKKIGGLHENATPEGFIIKNRHALAGTIVAEVQKTEKKKPRLSDRMWQIATDPNTALPALLIVFISILFILFKVGGWLSEVLEHIWVAAFAPPIASLIHAIAGDGLWAKVLNWGFNDGLFAAIGVGIPYVLVFYLILAFLEDSGYLNSVSFLLDKALHSIGLHGKAFIPMTAAIGCSVPAVMGTRILGSRRERIIAITLIVLIACSARTTVIFGAVSRYVGFFWALSLILLNIALVIATGALLNKIMPGDSEGLVMEVFPFRRPHLPTVLKKTWVRFADFLWIATPIVVVGSMAIGYLYESNYIWTLEKPFRPLFEGWLGLPAIAGLTLLFAVLRKELALQFLITLAVAQTGMTVNSLTQILSLEQIYTFTLFNMLYMPCIATIAVMGREIGWKWTAGILAGTLIFTIAFTGIVHKFLMYTGWLS